MARGWESKSIEAQQEEAARNAAKARPKTPEQRMLAERRRTLELAKSNATTDLNRAKAPAHREMLERALEALDQRIGELDDGPV